jgi:hypothetical protein
MKKIAVALVLAGGLTAVAFASLNSSSSKKEKATEKKMEKKDKKKECRRICPFS